MLTRLLIENFAIIDQLELRFGSGLVILTGETGAGKSIILDAITALLGGTFEGVMLRSGASRSHLEATFLVGPSQPDLAALLEREELLDEGEFLTIERDLKAEGRTSARINGRSVTQGLLREVGDHLVDIHGQSEHLSLLNPRQHIRLLDSYTRNEAELRDYQAIYRHLQEVRREMRNLRALEQEAAARLELLQFQEQEIRTARIVAGEDETLEQERNRLANAENLANGVQRALSALDESTSEAPTVTDLLNELNRQLQGMARLDPSRSAAQEAGLVLLDQAEELARDLRAYSDTIEFNPQRLAEVEERIGVLTSLKRKYGPTVDAIQEFYRATQAKLAAIQNSSERSAELSGEEEKLWEQALAQAAGLTQKRQSAAEALTRAMEAELSELKMEGARFQVQIVPLQDPSANPGSPKELDANGQDRVEFLIAPNPGEGLKPLVKVASGGETSRLMLAIKNVLAREDNIPSLIFDEIDQGIGGRVGSIVGQKLWQLARHHQVFCVTHLPQLAAFGDQHFHVRKEITDGRTLTRVDPLEGEQRVRELAQMLGNLSDHTLRSAEELLRTSTGDQAV